MQRDGGKRSAGQRTLQPPKEFFENHHALLPKCDWRLLGSWGSIEAMDAAQSARVEACITEGANYLTASNLTREELANACARAEVHGSIAVDELRNSRAFFQMLMSDFQATVSALDEIGDIDQAREKIRATLTFNFERLLNLASSAARAAASRKAALALHAKSTPKSIAKQSVFEMFLGWKAHPTQYPSTAAFARAMLDKFPDELTSQAVIEGWVRGWRKASST